MSEVPLHLIRGRDPSCECGRIVTPGILRFFVYPINFIEWEGDCGRVRLASLGCEDRVLDGPASGEKGSKGGP